MPPTDEDIAWFQSSFRPIPKATLPEDCIEYSIHVISSHLDPNNDSELRVELRNIQKYSNELHKQWLKDYIWQRQGFTLEIVKEDGVSHLRGRSEYGDSIEDEWVIVWLLRELTKKFKSAWVKVTDSDGEFLLIEASGTIPAWLEPEVAENRVWITEGQLKILKPVGTARSSKRTIDKLSLQEARRIILMEPKQVMHSSGIEEEAFYRLRNYPAQIKDNMHHALVKLPRKVAFLLLQKPAYIAPAIEAFYLRDPIALKPLQKKDNEDNILFPPKDLVTLSVKIPKVGYAQVRSQDFTALPMWVKTMPSKLDVRDYARAETGMKITSGFEMLLSDSQYQDRASVREMKMLLDDLETGDETLPSDEDLSGLDKTEDDEKWLDINLEDLDRELGGKGGTKSEGKKRGFNDKPTQENLQRIVKQFEDFLNDDKAGPDDSGMFGGSDDDDDDDDDDDEDEEDEDVEGSFDEDEFTKMMQEMMGMPPEVMKELMSGPIDALAPGQDAKAPSSVRERAKAKVQEVDSGEEEDIMDMKHMEAELRASGALNLNPGKQTNGSRGQALKTINENAHGQNDSSSEAEEGEDEEADFDAEFARNLLQSFRSGGGSGGPAANLLSMMGDPAGESSKTRKGGSSE